MDISKIQSASIRTPGETGEDTVVTVNGMTFTASSQSGAISQALDYLGEETTPENIVEFIELAVKGKTLGNPVSSVATGANWPSIDEQPVKSTKKRKAKAEKKPKSENELIGKLFLGKKGELLRVVNVTPPADWQFELEYLDTDKRGTIGLFGLKEFKELIELVPKRSKKEG